MKIYHVAIIEDDQASAKYLIKCLEKYGGKNQISFHVAEFGNAENFLENYRPVYDIVFMDIELGKCMNGIEAAKRLRQFDNLVILYFVTSMPQYAINGYEVGALDYFLKPINYNSFSVKLDKAFALISRHSGFTLKVRVENGIRVVMSSDVYYIEVMNHDVIYHTTNGVVISYGTLNERERQLAPFDFVRCSACMLVNLKYVEGLYGDEISVDGERLKISRGKKKEFLQKLNDFLGEGNG